jgi:preprotein translocase subunit SecF
MIDFLKYRNMNFALSFLFFLASGTAWYAYGIHYSVDFDGGTQVILGFSKPVSSTEVKSILASRGWEGAITREFSKTEVLVRVKEFIGDAKGEAERLKNALGESLSGVEVTIKSQDSVGPAAGANLRLKAIYAVLIGLVLMLAYIAMRFEFSFAMGAVLSLLHDALVMIGAFIILGLEMSPYVIVAILTILGYSINDTIVIFTRIRENLAKKTRQDLYEVVNVSINQTLIRTLLTSFATCLTVVSFLVLGGESLRDLSLALLVGMIVGTYSSIYIASPVMMLLHKNN